MWMQFGIKDFLDILLSSFLLYQIYRVMKRNGTLTIFSGIVSFVAAWIVISQILEMRLLGSILDKFISVGLIAIIILFQDEIRKGLFTLGSHKKWKFLSYFFNKKKNQLESEGSIIAPIVLACMNMAKKKKGALIVLQQDMDLTAYAQTGELFTADVNARLIENIFFTNSPLHDGAMIIADGQIKAAGCILPVAQNANLPKELGLRHRAALGMTIETDAIVIIVSEERGVISLASKGEIKTNISAEKLQQVLSSKG